MKIQPEHWRIPEQYLMNVRLRNGDAGKAYPYKINSIDMRRLMPKNLIRKS